MYFTVIFLSGRYQDELGGCDYNCLCRYVLFSWKNQADSRVFFLKVRKKKQAFKSYSPSKFLRDATAHVHFNGAKTNSDVTRIFGAIYLLYLYTIKSCENSESSKKK